MGAEAVRKLLHEAGPRAACRTTSQGAQATTGSKQKAKDLINRLKIVEVDSRLATTSLSGWCWTSIPVIPPDLRPLVLLDRGNFAHERFERPAIAASSTATTGSKKLVDLNAPEVIIRNEKRMLQQSVDALFDNNRCKRPVLGSATDPAQVAGPT